MEKIELSFLNIRAKTYHDNITAAIDYKITKS